MSSAPHSVVSEASDRSWRAAPAWLLGLWALAMVLGANRTAPAMLGGALLTLGLGVFLVLRARDDRGFSSLLQAWRAQPVAIIALLLFAWIGFRALTSGLSFIQALHGWWIYQELLLLALLASVPLSARQRRILIIALIVGAVVSAGHSYLKLIHLLPRDAPPLQFQPPRGPIGGGWVISLGALASLALALDAWRLQHRRQAAAWILSATFCLAVPLFLVAGRTAWIMLLLIASILFLQLTWRGIAVSIVAVSLALVLAWQFSPVMKGRFLGSVAVLEAIQRDTQLPGYAEVSDPSDAMQNSQLSTGIRLEFLRLSIEAWKQSFWWGHGIGRFEEAYAAAGKASGMRYGSTSNPHNEFVLLGVQAGVLAPLGLMGVFLALFLASFRAWPRSSTERIFIQGLALTTTCGCLLNSFLLDANEGRLFAMLAAALVAPKGQEA